MISAVIHRYQAVFVFALMAIIMGTISYMTLPRESSPEIKQPKIFVNTVYPGVAAKDIENLITQHIEEEIEGLEGVKDIFSTNMQGLSAITVDFTSDTKVETALRRVKERVDIAKTLIPSEAEEPVVKELNFSEQPILIVVLSNLGGLEVIEDLAEGLEDELKRVQGVLDVKLSGQLEKELLVELDPSKLSFYGVSISDVQNAINRENKTIPGGQLKGKTVEYSLSVSGEIKNPEDFGKILIGVKGKNVSLNELGTIKLKYKEPATYSRINGNPAISLSITKRSGENLISIADEIKKILSEKEAEFPQGTEYRYSFDESKKIKDMVLDLENNIFTGLVLVLAVSFLFLGFTNAVFVGMAIPFSMLLSFIALSFAGITLNMVVLFSLILALGMLVDNGIVIVENIYRHASMGKDRMQSAIDGTKEVAMPIISSTATTILAFFPIIYMPDIMGEFMSYIPKTVIIVLTSSLVVGLLFNSTFCARFLKVTPKQMKAITEGGGVFGKFQAHYLGVLEKMLKNPFKMVGLSILFVFSGLAALIAVGKEPVFFPSLDPSVAIVDIELPQGSRVFNTDEVSKEVEKVIPYFPNSIKNLQTTSGRGSGEMMVLGDESHKANIRIGFEDFLERKIRSKETIEALKDTMSFFTAAKVKIRELKEGPPTGHDVSFEVTGLEYGKIGIYANEILAVLNQYNDFERVDYDYEEGSPEIKIDVDRDLALRLGVNTTLIAQTVRSAINGGLTSKLRMGDDEYDVNVRYAGDYRNDLISLGNLEIVHEDKRVPLKSIAKIYPQPGPGKIKRKNLKRTVEIFADFKPAATEKLKIKKEIEEKIAQISVEKDYRIGTGEGQKSQQEATQFLEKAFGIAFFLILILLIVQFNSITQQLIIMASVFLSLGGVFWGYAFGGVLADQSFVIIMSGIGIISLAGVVVNNAIVLIDYTNQLVNQGMYYRDAIIESGRTRLRPVLLTAITTVAGLVPMAIGASFDFHTFTFQLGSESADWWKSMAWTIIYGLSVATFLTLCMIPVLLYIDFKYLSKLDSKVDSVVENS